MIDFIRLQLKLTYGANKNDNKLSTILTVLLGLIVAGVFLAMIYFLSQMLYVNLKVSPQQLSIIFITAIELVLTVIGVTLHMKRLYRPADLNITARFPISTFKLYLSNIILIYINLLIFSFLLFTPVMVLLGVATGAISVKFVFAILLGVFFAPMVPFALSTLISIPVMWILSLLEHKNIVKLLIFIAFVVLFFVLYDQILTMLANFFIHKNIGTESSNVWLNIINGMNGWYNPCFWLANIFFVNGFWAGFGVTLALFVGLSAIGISCAKPLYNKVVRNSLEGGDKKHIQKTKVDGLSATSAMFRHGFMEIIRNKTFAYFYLGIAIATPVMVFFCDRLVTLVGQSTIGGKISFGASTLVISCFMAMISAFASISISMEGKQFYITKMVPVKYSKQLLMKAVQNLLVSTGASLLSCIVIVSLKFVTPVQAIVLFVLNLLLAMGFVFNGINLNLANPNLKYKASGEIDEINITVMMLLGFILSAIIGAGAIALPFIIDFVWTYVIVFAVVIVYLLINVLVFIFTANKKYRMLG